MQRRSLNKREEERKGSVFSVVKAVLKVHSQTPERVGTCTNPDGPRKTIRTDEVPGEISLGLDFRSSAPGLYQGVIVSFLTDPASRYCQ
ncbi:hypothetical protein KIL84_016518 [Mauremys mutica]|uniref:Uncharacterized protein n=1 Tax=Mauremys mutica TaxID=74926 RepID=A0A9D4AWH1_9SAUR|nr:hypothetical protein KIL84_016518 [Mauremys mutica]